MGKQGLIYRTSDKQFAVMEFSRIDTTKAILGAYLEYILEKETYLMQILGVLKVEFNGHKCFYILHQLKNIWNNYEFVLSLNSTNSMKFINNSITKHPDKQFLGSWDLEKLFSDIEFLARMNRINYSLVYGRREKYFSDDQ